MSAWLRWLLLLSGIVACAVASVLANIWFYRSLAVETYEQQLYAAMGYGSDAFKMGALSAAALIIAGGGLAWKLFGWAVRGLWAVAVLVSIVAAVGFTTGVQAELEDPKANALNERAQDQNQLRADVAEMEGLLGCVESELGTDACSIPAAPSEVAAELAQLLDSPPVYKDGREGSGTLRTQLTARTGVYCDGSFDGPLTRAHCPTIRALEAEEARAERYVQLSTAIRDARARLRTVDTPASGSAEHVAFVTLAELWNYTPGWVKAVTLFVFAVLVEALSSTGMEILRKTAPKGPSMKWWRLDRAALACVAWVSQAKKTWRTASLPEFKVTERAPRQPAKPRVPPAAPPAPKRVETEVSPPPPPKAPPAPKPAPAPQPAIAGAFSPVPERERGPRNTGAGDTAPRTPAHGDFKPRVTRRSR